MPRCNIQDCTKTSGLSRLDFYDPIEQLSEEVFLCQYHSDKIIEYEMFSYIAEGKTIDFLQAKRKKEEKMREVYNQQPIKDIYEKIQYHYNLKKTISNYKCRNLICKNKITKNQFRYVVTAFYKYGNFRHYFYFCCLSCFNSIKAKCGILVPILQKQTSLR